MFPKLIPFVIKIVKKNLIFVGIVIGVFGVFLVQSGFEYTSTDQFCGFCHAHPHITESWKLSTHYKNESGVVVHCVECHLPPGGLHHITEKTRLGIRDTFSALFKDVSRIDWEAKGRLKHARTHTYDTSCIRCHAELFSLDLSKKGVDGHVHYFHKKDEIRCINCHLNVGHYSEEVLEEEKLTTITPERRKTTIPPKPLSPDVFVDYAEIIPGTEVVFEMIAIPGGTFFMGSPASESRRRTDEGPLHQVRVSSFWMGRAEVSWDEWDVYYQKNATRGKYASLGSNIELDAVTGPTPPYGSPDQGWGRGLRPAITMTHHAAMKYCEWLSSVTGDKYRLPTEAEWEYASRGATSDPYFFDGNPSKMTRRSWINRIFGVDTSGINGYVWYELNSSEKTHPPYSKRTNPFGLLNVLGNVKEFCFDWYAPDAYNHGASDSIIINPRGPKSGIEHVIRGGSFQSDAVDLRCASRDHTRHEEWLLTDPQSPKSIWWYSDCYDVGFRVVREYEGRALILHKKGKY